MDRKEVITNEVTTKEANNRIPVILVLGYGKVGKDTTSDYLVEKYGYKKKGSGDKMRELQEHINPSIEHEYIYTDASGGVCKTKMYKTYKQWIEMYGYDAAKDVKNVSGFRQSLVNLAEGMKAVFGDEVWIDTILPYGGKETGIVISDGRNRYEAMRVLHYGGLVIRLTRDGVGPANETEKKSVELAMDTVHETIENNGTKEELYAKIDDVIRRYNDARR